MRGTHYLAVTLVMLFHATSATAAEPPCVLQDNGNGTVDLPPAGCEYLSPMAVHELIDAAGLPAGSTIEFSIEHQDFVCAQGKTIVDFGIEGCSVTVDPVTCEGPGPVAGTVTECFASQAVFHIQGTGTLALYSETFTLEVTPQPVTESGDDDADGTRSAKARGNSRAEKKPSRGLPLGEAAPAVVGEDLDGIPFKLADYRGKVTVVTFWGFW